jgi:hypothetical protein
MSTVKSKLEQARELYDKIVHSDERIYTVDVIKLRELYEEYIRELESEHGVLK